jgi:AraC-like DNA-binding protein
MTGDIRLFDTSLAEFQYAMNKRISSETTARYNEFKAMYELEDKLRQIETQQQEIRDKRRQITFLGIFLLLAVGVAGGIGFLLIRTRFLMQELFRKNEVILEQRLAAPESPSTDTTGVDDKLWQLFRDIDTAMDRQHLYRDSKLTLSSLSKQFASNDTYVSRAINLHANVNFNTYINNYRVLAAQKMMTVKGKSPNIEEIREQCGFSSRQSFFRIFKQQTGLTPSQYITQARFDRPAGVFSDIPDSE